MAVDNTKLSLIEMGDVWEPALPSNPGAFGQDDKQQLLWGYSNILWTPTIAPTNEILSLIEWCSPWEPGLPISPGTFGQNDKQQLLVDQSSVLWSSGPSPAPGPSDSWWFTHFILGH